LQDATPDHACAVVHDYALHNQDASTDNHDDRKNVRLSSAAAKLAGSHGRQGRILTYCVAKSSSAHAGKHALNNTSGSDTAPVDEMLFYNMNNISTPYHLQKIGAWYKTIRIQNPKSLLVGQKAEQKME
jgi:hypothetical protein